MSIGHSNLRFCLLMVVVSVSMLACASTPREPDSARLARYEAHAGEPVSSIFYSPSSGGGFDVIDDEHLVLMQSPARNWLLRVDPPCLSMDSSPYLLIDSQNGKLSANFDAVVSRTQPGMRCRIREIRPVDIKALREAEQAQGAEQGGV